MNNTISTTKILVVEDDPNLGYILQESLELQNFSVTRCNDGEEGQISFLNDKFDLCLIDVMLPKKDGFTLAKNIRQVDQHIPIIFLTAKSLKEDRVEGFKIGADDYITKPFSMEELILRIQAVLRRSKNNHLTNPNQAHFTIGDFLFDYGKQVLFYKNKEQKLTYKESELLRLLCLHTNQILDRNVALNQIWGDDSIFNSRSLDVFISKLRKHLKIDPTIEIINIRGVGYKLITG